jgi:hypothetical protein
MEMIMLARFTKVLVGALVLGAASLAFVADASARSMQAGWQVAIASYMHERHDPTDTNGN